MTKSLVIDCETTGLLLPSVSDLNDQPRIIEFGAVVIQDGDVVQSYNQLINPGFDIETVITKITGITNDDLKGKPKFSDVADEIYAMFEGAEMVIAHNVEFDSTMVRNEFKRMNRDIVMPELVCTVQEFYHIYGRRMKLTELYRYFLKKELKQTHRALDDVEALVEILQHINYWS